MVVPGFVVHGIAALVIILAILALLVLGIVSFFRMWGGEQGGSSNPADAGKLADGGG